MALKDGRHGLAMPLLAVMGALGSGPLAAETVIDTAAVFAARGASQYGTGAANTFSAHNFFGVDIDTGSMSFGGIEETFVGDFGAKATVELDARFGLETDFVFDTGSVDVTLPYSLKLDLDDAGNNHYNLGTQFSFADTSQFSSNFADFSFDSRVVIDVDRASVVASACLFGCFLDSVELVPTALRSFDAELPLLSFDSGTNTTRVFGATPQLGAEVSVPLKTTAPTVDATFELQINVPGDPNEAERVNVITAEVSTGLTNKAGKDTGLAVGTELAELRFAPPGDKLDVTVTGTAATAFSTTRNQDVVALELDVDGIASAVGLPLPPGGATFSAGPLDVTVDILDFDFGPALGVEQALTFDARPSMTLAFDREVGYSFTDSQGNTVQDTRSSVTFDPMAITSLQVTADREVGVTPTFSLSPTLRNNLDLTLRPKATVSAVSGSVDLDGTVIANFDPLYEKELTAGVAPSKVADIFDQVFGLDGTGRDLGTLERFTIAAGKVLAGDSADNALDPVSTVGNSATYSVDFNQANGPARTVKQLPGGQIYRGSQPTYREVTEKAISFQFASDLLIPFQPIVLPPVVKNVAQPGDRFGDLPSPITVSTTSDRPDRFDPVESGRTVSSPGTATGCFKDFPTVCAKFPGVATEDQRITQHFEDLLTTQTLTRSAGVGSDQALFLDFDLLSGGATGRDLDIFNQVNFRIPGAVAPGDLDFASHVFNRPGGGLSNDPLALPAFETLSFGHGANSHMGRLLTALGDNDGLSLDIRYGDGRSGNSSFSFQFDPRDPSCGSFHTIDSNCVFNFADDFLFAQPGLFGTEPLIDAQLMNPQGYMSTIGLWDFTISGLDVNVADRESLISNLIDNVDLALNLGLTFTDPAYNGLFFIATDHLHNDPSSQQTVDVVASGGSTTRVNAREAPGTPPPPVAAPMPPPEDPVNNPPPAADVERIATCTRTSCDDGTPLVKVTTTNFLTGETVEESVSASAFLATRNQVQPLVAKPPATPPAVPAGLPAGILPQNALAPTSDRGAVFGFDFATVDGWGSNQQLDQLVFNAGGFLQEGTTPCSAGVSGLRDGQVLAQAPVGAALGPPVGLQRNGNSYAALADCFQRQVAGGVYGVDAFTYLGVPYAPTFDLSIDGPRFTSLTMPLIGDNLLLTQKLSIQLWDEQLNDFSFAGLLDVGGIYRFDDPISRFRIAGLDINLFNLDSDGSFIDRSRGLLFGFTVTEPGTVISFTAQRVQAQVPAPATVWLLLLGTGVLLWRRHHRRRPIHT